MDLTGAPVRRTARSLFQSTAARLFVLAFAVYNVNLRSITNADTNPTRYLPISIIKEFNLDLDEFPFLLDYPRGGTVEHGTVPHYLRQVDGHYMSTYPVMPAVLATPVYLVPVLLGLTDGAASGIGFTQTEVVGTFLSKIAASLAVALSVGIVYLSLLWLTDRRSAFWIALLYAFATSSWSVSSQGLWQTAMSQPLLAAALYFLLRGKENERSLAYAGAAMALSVACRPPNIIFAVVLSIYVLHAHRGSFVRFAIAPIGIAALLIAYNFDYFGTLTGGYSSMIGGPTKLPRWQGLPGLLLSPSRGLFVFSPFLIFAFAGLGSVLYRRRDLLLTYTAVATVLTVLFYAGWSDWYGDFSYSYRFLVDLLPGLTLLLAVVYNRLMAEHWRRALFISFAAFSVLAQIVGAFFYPCGWYDHSRLGRYWDWRNPEMVSCLMAGPVSPDGLRYVKERLGRF